MALTIDELEIKIEAEASKAEGGIEALAKSLRELRSAVGDSSGLSTSLANIANALKTFNGLGRINLTSKINQLRQFQELIPMLGGPGGTQLASNLRDIAYGMASFAAVPKINISSFATGIKRLEEVTRSLDGPRLTELFHQLRDVSSALAQLNAVEKGNLGSVVNSLKKIPEITKSLDATTIENFSVAVKRLVEALAPLAAQMESVARGFSSLPTHMQRAIKASNQVTAANKRMNSSYGSTSGSLSLAAARFWTLYYTMSRVVDLFASAFNESNEYIESLNLFTVSMGEASESALEFAETVSDAMGIDVAEWITNQGVFMRMATGFGVAADKAEVMSQNLTQLAYDMSSFFNTDVQTAMEKLQSGMSGQIKGLKAWGYNLSVAALQETALSLGIEQSVRSMTEAQKAQLRYITLIQRSQGVMGDMARTIVTPANSMRILSAQIVQLKRSFGQIVSVLVTQVIPYIQAFVEIVADAATEIAEFFGFEMPKIDYSNLDLAADVMDGVDDSINDTEESVKGLKKQLMGFDELNILKSGDDDKDESDGVRYDLGIDLPEYDFLGGLSEEYREHIDEIKKTFDGLLDYILPIGGMIAGAFVLNWIPGVVEKFKGLKVISAVTDAIRGSLIAADIVFQDTGSMAKFLGTAFKTLWTSFKNFMSGLNPVVKGLVAIIALYAEFKVIKGAVKDLVLGNKDLGDSLLKIIPIAAAVGVAMYAMLGPWGLVLAAVVGVAGAIAGFNEAHKEMRAELVKNTFFGEYGTTVSELAGAFSELMTNSTKAYDAINAKQAEILTAKKNITDTNTEVSNLVWGVENGAIDIENAIPTIVSAFETLYNESKTFLEDTRDLIISALSGSMGEVLVQNGVNIGELGAATGELTESALEEIERINNENAELKEKFEAGTIGSDEYFSQLMDNVSAIQELSRVETEEDGAIADAKASFEEAIKDALEGNLTWNPKTIDQDLSAIVGAADEAKATITEAYGAVIEAFKTMQDMATDEATKNMFGEAIAATTKAMEDDLAGIDEQLVSVFDAVQLDFLKKIGSAYGDAYEDFFNQSGFYQMFHKPTGYAVEGVEDFLEGEGKAILDAFSNFFGENAWVEDAIYDALENYDAGSFDPVSAFMEQLKKSANDETGPAFEIGELIGDGLIGGLTEKQWEVYQQAMLMGKSMEEAMKEALDINSPSRVMWTIGKQTVEGLANGMTDNLNILEEAVKKIVSCFDITTGFKSFWGRVKGLFSGVNVNGYASGGFPSVGEMFIARESGPELVGRIGNRNAVANNDQIVTDIATAVYNAMMAANEDGNHGGGNARIIVQIGDQAVGEASVRYINGQIVQTGVSPIYN